MVKNPVVTTFAVGLPDMVANALLATTDALAAPPLNLPMRDVAEFESKLAPPVVKKTRPKNIKASTVVPTILTGRPKRAPGSR